MAWRRRPLVHFLLIGGALFALRPTIEPDGDAAAGAEPEPGMNRAADEDVLVEEALRRGFGDDIVVRQRLDANLAFLGLSPANEAIVAAMRAKDPVVRRRLAQRMRFALEAGSSVDWPSAAEIDTHLARHPRRDGHPGAVRFEQILLSHARHGGEAHAKALGLLAQVRGRGPAASATVAGDPIPAGNAGMLTPAGIAKYFGPSLASAVMAAPVGEWSGPWRSELGVHLVYVVERDEPRPPDAEAARKRAGVEILAARRTAALARGVAQLSGGRERALDAAIAAPVELP